MKNKLFSVGEIGGALPKNDENGPKAKSIEFLRIHSQKIESIKHLTGHLPGENELMILWTIKSFNAFTFIPYIIKEVGPIEFLTVTTYSINRRIIDAMIRLLDKGKINKIELFISDSIKYRMPKVVDHLNGLIEVRGEQISIIYAWVHAKVTMIKAQDQYFTIAGSGNWGENAQYEQYFFLKNKQAYDFFRKEAVNELYR